MQRILGLFMVSMTLASSTTLEVLQVFQPLSLHGTDVDHEFEGESIQARVMSRPMVLSGAMPENLIEAIGEPYRMPKTFNYAVKECNLLQLYGLKMSGMMTDKAVLVVTISLDEARVPDQVDLPIRTVLRLSIEALKRTLGEYHHPENKPIKVRIDLAGLSEKNASLRDLSGIFQVVGR